MGWFMLRKVYFTEREEGVTEKKKKKKGSLVLVSRTSNSLAGLDTIFMQLHWHAPTHYFITTSAMSLANPGYSFASFYFHSGLLNYDDKRHLFVLHYIFIPWINRVSKRFVKSWNKHPIRTENNWSPEQIWTNGMIDL